MAATVYIADIKESNVNNIMEDFTQAYPPKGDVDFLLERAGSHWKRGDATRKLPEFEEVLDEL